MIHEYWTFGDISDPIEQEQYIAEGVYGVPLEMSGGGWDEIPTYDPDALDEGPASREVSWSFGSDQREKPIDPAVYKGTHLDFYTLEEYRALNPRKAS